LILFSDALAQEAHHLLLKILGTQYLTHSPRIISNAGKFIMGRVFPRTECTHTYLSLAGARDVDGIANVGKSRNRQVARIPIFFERF
jgi:hypothetical protein